MQRFTISLDDELADGFDRLIAGHGYASRSEAVRDLIRERLGCTLLEAGDAKWCIANVSYVYDHHDQLVVARVVGAQHEHHDLVVSSLHTHLDHHHCMESVVLRGPVPAVSELARKLIALRGVRHGAVHLVPLADEQGSHRHGGQGPVHGHQRPIA